MTIPNPMENEFDLAIARIPRWMLGLALLGTVISQVWWGLPAATGFLAGSLAAWLNFHLIERAVNRISRLASGQQEKRASGSGKRIFIQFAFLLLGAFAILRFSGFSVAAGCCGFLICPTAVMLEIIYELFTYGHS